MVLFCLWFFLQSVITAAYIHYLTFTIHNLVLFPGYNFNFSMCFSILQMASLQGLPPLPKSLSGLLNFSSAQWKELERLHTMRTMIQQDLNRGTNLQRVPSHGDSADNVESEHSSPASEAASQSRSGRLDVQLALLRKEMVLLLF